MATYDINTIGEIEYSWDFDEDEYEDYLEDNSLSDSEESRYEYISNYVSFSLELFDNETFHHMDYQTMSIEDIENEYGEEIAKRILSDCIEDGEGRLEVYDVLTNVTDCNDPEQVNAMAKKLFPTGDCHKNDRGFILTDGTFIHTEGEHSYCTKIDGVKNTYHFIRLGNIRTLDHSIDICVEPTNAQYMVLRNLLGEYEGEELSLDLGDNGPSVRFSSVNPMRVYNQIQRYFREGIPPRDDMYEERILRRIIREAVDELELFHGSKADFDEFDLAFLSSGVGHQVHGYGVYLTNSADTAREYSRGGIVYTVKVPEGKYLSGNRISPSNAMSIAKAYYKWSLEEDEYRREAYKGCEKEYWDYECSSIAESRDGDQVYGTISSLCGSDKEASEFLYRLGYKGIKWKETIADGTSFNNYVIFNPRDIQILGKEKIN